MRFSSVFANGAAMGETQKWSPVHLRAPHKGMRVAGRGLESEPAYNYGEEPEGLL
jgi:hypothetical protein